MMEVTGGRVFEQMEMSALSKLYRASVVEVALVVWTVQCCRLSISSARRKDVQALRRLTENVKCAYGQWPLS
jgi:hypothetical protein